MKDYLLQFFTIAVEIMQQECESDLLKANRQTPNENSVVAKNEPESGDIPILLNTSAYMYVHIY